MTQLSGLASCEHPPRYLFESKKTRRFGVAGKAETSIGSERTKQGERERTKRDPTYALLGGCFGASFGKVRLESSGHMRSIRVSESGLSGHAQRLLGFSAHQAANLHSFKSVLCLGTLSKEPVLSLRAARVSWFTIPALDEAIANCRFRIVAWRLNTLRGERLHSVAISWLQHVTGLLESNYRCRSNLHMGLSFLEGTLQRVVFILVFQPNSQKAGYPPHKRGKS